MAEEKKEEYPDEFDFLLDELKDESKSLHVYAQIIFDEAKKLGWPYPLTRAICSMILNQEWLNDDNTKTYAGADNLTDVESFLKTHKHLPDGQMVVPP